MGAGVAYAFFTGNGTGNGSANVGKGSNLTITQIGAGYDSLVHVTSGDPYIQDQAFNAASITEFGNDITLANPGYQQLVSVVVAMRNWGAAVNNLPITLSINNTANGPISDTQDFSFAANNADGSPSLTNITFTFPKGDFVNNEFVYGISFSPSDAPSLNVALSSSTNDLTIGSDTHQGTVWLSATDSSIGNDFPVCSTPVPTAVFEQVKTACGDDSNPNNPGAYGTPADVAAGNADIPAVEVNVVGGIVPSLYPGGPSQPVDFAVYNPGPSSAYITSVTGTIESVTTGSIAGDESCKTDMYSLAGNPDNFSATVLPGQTIWESPSNMTISMQNDGNNQDNCEGAVVTLGFSSP